MSIEEVEGRKKTVEEIKETLRGVQTGRHVKYIPVFDSGLLLFSLIIIAMSDPLFVFHCKIHRGISASRIPVKT